MESKKCKRCGQEFPINEFGRNHRSQSGYTDVCIHCINQARQATREIRRNTPPLNVANSKNLRLRLPQKGANPSLAEFETRTLIEELKSRGLKGTLEYVYTINI